MREKKRAPSLTEIFQDTRRNATCSARQCAASIVFATVVKSGKTMPFDAPLLPVDARDVDGRIFEKVDLVESHFASCVAARQFRRAR